MIEIKFTGNTHPEVVSQMAEYLDSLMGVEPVPAPVPEKAGPGRPAGVKDSKPRKPRGVKNAEPPATPAATAKSTTAGGSQLEVTDAAKDEVGASTPSIPVPSVPVGSAPNAPKLKDAQDALAKLFEAKGMDAALKMLIKFKAKKVQEMDPTLFSEFIAACEAA